MACAMRMLLAEFEESFGIGQGKKSQGGTDSEGFRHAGDSEGESSGGRGSLCTVSPRRRWSRAERVSPPRGLPRQQGVVR